MLIIIIIIYFLLVHSLISHTYLCYLYYHLFFLVSLQLLIIYNNKLSVILIFIEKFF